LRPDLSGAHSVGSEANAPSKLLDLWRLRLERKDPKVTIQNVVASVTLKQRLDLDLVLRVTQGASYKPEQFPGLVYKLKKPKASALLFGSGKMVCVGTTSEERAKEAVNRIVDALKKNGVAIAGKPEIEIQNIVASGDLFGSVDLEAALATLKRTMYEPEQFPGLMYRMEEPKVVMLLFASGKLVCTGAKKEEQVHEAVEKLQKELEAERLIHYE